MKTQAKTRQDIPEADAADSLFGLAGKLTEQIYDLNNDIESLAWAYETLWHHEFSIDTDMEKLSYLPVSMLRLLAARVRQINGVNDRLLPSFHRHHSSVERWFAEFGDKVAAELQDGAP